MSENHIEKAVLLHLTTNADTRFAAKDLAKALKLDRAVINKALYDLEKPGCVQRNHAQNPPTWQIGGGATSNTTEPPRAIHTAKKQKSPASASATALDEDAAAANKHHKAAVGGGSEDGGTESTSSSTTAPAATSLAAGAREATFAVVPGAPLPRSNVVVVDLDNCGALVPMLDAHVAKCIAAGIRKRVFVFCAMNYAGVKPTSADFVEHAKGTNKNAAEMLMALTIGSLLQSGFLGAFEHLIFVSGDASVKNIVEDLRHVQETSQKQLQSTMVAAGSGAGALAAASADVSSVAANTAPTPRIHPSTRIAYCSAREADLKEHLDRVFQQ